MLEPGDVFLVNPGEPHACDPLDDEPFSYRCANVPVGVMAALSKRGGEGTVAGSDGRAMRAPRFAVPVLHDPALFARADALFARAAHEGPGALAELDGLLCALLAAADAAAGSARACAEPGGPVAAARTFVAGGAVATSSRPSPGTCAYTPWAMASRSVDLPW